LPLLLPHKYNENPRRCLFVVGTLLSNARQPLLRCCHLLAKLYVLCCGQ
jgi:hypothetical protein